MDILIRSTPAEVAIAAADIFVRYANAGATLGLATGSTPVAMYQELTARYELCEDLAGHLVLATGTQPRTIEPARAIAGQGR